MSLKYEPASEPLQGLVSAISTELYKTEVDIDVETNEEGAVFHIQVRFSLPACPPAPSSRVLLFAPASRLAFLSPRRQTSLAASSTRPRERETGG